MPRLRDEMTLKRVKIEEIEPSIAPVEKLKQESLIESGQRDPIKLAEIQNGRYKYQVIDGRRRLASMIASDEESVLALVKRNLTNRVDLALEALISNSGTPNEYDEALHIINLKEQGWNNKKIAKAAGYSEATISQRTKLVTDLHPELQKMLQLGDINVSTALEACRIPIREQEARILTLNKINWKNVVEAVREWQGEQISEVPLFDIPESNVKPGVFLTGEQMEELVNGEVVIISYQGEKFVISGRF